MSNMKDEMMVRTTHGTYPQSRLSEANKEAKAKRERYYEEQRKIEEERIAKKKAIGFCPLAYVSDFDPSCKLEKCALYSEEGCILTKMAESGANKTVGKRCPIRGRNCVENCALNVDGGCVITGLFARKEN